MPPLGASNTQPLGPTQTISSSRNFVRPQPRHPLNRPATLWLNENAKENNPSPPLIHSNNQIIASRAALSPKIHRDIIPQPDSAHRPLRPPLGNVTNSSARSGVLAPTGRSVREECTMKAAPPGVPHSRGELSELANFLKSTGPEDFTCRDPRIGTPGPGASMVFVDVPIKEDQSTSKALVDSVNRESLANRRKNTGRWLKKAVGMLWGGPSKGEFKEEPAAKEQRKLPVSTVVLKAPDPQIQTGFVGKTPLAVFGRNATVRQLNSPGIELSVSGSPLVNDPPRLPPLADAVMSPGGTERPVAISSLADLKDTLLCMSAEVAARSRTLRRSNTEESFSDILPAADAMGTVEFGNRRPVGDGVGSEADSLSVYSTDSGVVLAKEAEDEKRVGDSLVFDMDHLPTGLLLNMETPSISSPPETPAECYTPKPTIQPSRDSSSTLTPTLDIQLLEEGQQHLLRPLEDAVNSSDEVAALPYNPAEHRKWARTSIASICKETGKQYFFVEFRGLFFPMPPTYTSPKIEYGEITTPEGDVSRLAHELTRTENDKRFATLFEEADEVLREIRIVDAKDGFREANSDSSWTTTSSVSNINSSGLSRSFNSSSSLATPGVLSTYTTSTSSDGLLPDENDPDSGCWLSPLTNGMTRIRIVPATPSPRLGGGVLRKPRSPSQFRSLSTTLEEEEALTDIGRMGLRIGRI